jgi:hypothetical protein
MTIPNINLLLESEAEIKLFPLIILSIMENLPLSSVYTGFTVHTMIFIGMINDEDKQEAWFGHWFIFPLSALSHLYHDCHT